ncbi:hypothetical protein [Rossellomorea marisflavi]|uniref:hypothetical protein n=1 Tax=Rossellomorea marisflavi TaxID=189381 RepID=UPI00345C7174
MKTATSYSYEKLDLELFKTLNDKKHLQTIDILEIDRDHNGVYSFRLQVKNLETTLYYDFNILNQMTIVELADMIRKDFKKAKKKEFVPYQDNLSEDDECEAIYYIVTRSLQYYLEGYPFSHIPGIIGYKTKMSRNALKYIKENLVVEVKDCLIIENGIYNPSFYYD